MPKALTLKAAHSLDLEYMVVQDNVVRLHPPWSPTREAARRSSDMCQARHLPQRVVLGYSSTGSGCDPPVHLGTNCNTNPKATVFGIPKNPYWKPQN
ncbi:hypothetical protein TNCV_2318801 [Trichonephila clavipes]|nr:hypothetical protein TNCV_2318801 [Trichonephila clavipes]